MALDAIKYRNSLEQFQPEKMSRELNKVGALALSMALGRRGIAIVCLCCYMLLCPLYGQSEELLSEERRESKLKKRRIDSPHEPNSSPYKA